jgi:membrane associated rhomboid family serine protease
MALIPSYGTHGNGSVGPNSTMTATTRSMLFPKWIWMLGTVVALPAAFTYLHFWNWLATQRCAITATATAVVDLGQPLKVDIYCVPPGSLPVRGQLIESSLPPTIAQLSTVLASFKPRRLLFETEEEDLIWDGNEWQANSTTKGDLTTLDKTILSFIPASDTTDEQVQKIDESVNYYGFRRNHKKKPTKKKAKRPIPVATILLLAVNIGMFVLLWNSHTDPQEVAINSNVFQDYGRAFTGNLAHFELRHLGFNMMSLSSLGMTLERHVYGSIPLLLYTASFLPLTTLCVVGLQHVRRRYLDPNASFPSMVGFSGILFAWMVVATLEGTSTCPIFFLPGLCFDTYQAFGMRVSLGPLVQLVVLQVILPRISFTGHLAGIVMGFAWHWNMLPSIEWLQPSILFPIVWMIGKQIHRIPQDESSSTNTASSVCTRLRLVRNSLMLHWLLSTLQFAVYSSPFVSQALLILILSFLIRRGGKVKEYFGMVGRGYVVLVLVTLVTDGMTLGGWLVTRQVWHNLAIAMTLLLARCLLFWMSLCLVCHGLYASNESSSTGTWKHVWYIMEPCRFFGHWLAEWKPRKRESIRKQESSDSVAPIDTIALSSCVV